MAQFDFPSTPAIGDLFQDSSSGAVYRWNGYAWVGGVTGIGLQTIKETRYLIAGAFTFTRDPKSSGFADIHLMGAMGGRPLVTWASGQLVLAGGGGAGAITIKWRYPLPASAPVVVGASSGTATAGASSFDTVLTANGGALGAGTSVASANPGSAGGGAGGPAGATGDENYAGQLGGSASVTQGNGVNLPAIANWMRGIRRLAVGSAVSGATMPAVGADPGAVVVVETLNP